MNKYSVLFAVMLFILPSIGVVAAQDEIKCCWEPCGTKVEQCDDETVFFLDELEDAEIRISQHGTVYLDVIDDGDYLTAGDIRLTSYHQYPPNTKVIPHDDDLKTGANGFIGDIAQDILTYVDLSAKSGLIGKFDVYDPVYIDLDNNGVVSQGDIRITAVPPLDVCNDDGTVIYTAGYFELDTWTVVQIGDFDCSIGQIWDLWEIGTNVGDYGGQDFHGYPDELIGYVDADCDTEWSCADKLYLNQPFVNPEGDDEYRWYFDRFVTPGDTRFFIPLDDPCVKDCGTKVQQGDWDAVYALYVQDDVTRDFYHPTWGYIDVNDNGVFDGFNKEGAYIDMDDDGYVTKGDVRLTDNSHGFEPNTKVKECDGDVTAEDNNLITPDELDPDDQVVFKYYDMDYYTTGNPDLMGYSLGDPLYMDMDNDSEVSINDVRISQVPVFDDQMASPYNTAGSIGDAYTRVLSIQDYDAEQNWPLEPLIDHSPDGDEGPAEVEDILGFIDTDCSGDWTCEDKLYLQQLYDVTGWLPNQHNYFVTTGDFRLYIPQSAIDEGWPSCGTKVLKCDIDQTYVLADNSDLGDDGYEVGYIDIESPIGEYSMGEDLYLDMDGNEKVSNGDVRLSNCSTRFDPNTKVADHDSDIGKPLTFSNGDFGELWYADVNYNDEYDLEDPLYLMVDLLGNERLVDCIRLTDVPIYDNEGLDLEAGEIGKAWSRVKPSDQDASWFDDDYSVVRINDLPGDDDMEDRVRVFDADCSGTWTCPDSLFIVQYHHSILCDNGGYTEDNWFKEYFVTPGDLRLYTPPSPCDDTGGQEVGECGDVNGDGSVNMLDVTLLFDHVTYGDPIADEDAADVNCDQSINMLDVTLLFDHVTYGDPLNCC